ncbi:MAG: T9SS type A sorting domain-containing protein [Lewinellaceae bacterium]|nr:T9SS type A sorting domain-containing protein [Lewinellaceae bacterium]
MIPLKFFFFAALAAVFYTTELQATTYYVCDCAAGADPNCIVGNDANNGTSSSTPWQTTTKVSAVFNSLQAGDHVLFAKGGAWFDASLAQVYNYNASASNPIVFDSYAPSWGGTAKPILTESRTGTNLFNFVDGGNADHDEGYIVRNLDLRGGGSGQWAVFAYNDADYITLENLDISGFGIGVHCAGANALNAGADGQNQHMKLLNSTITDCYAQGFLGGGDYLQIEDCYFENNGFAAAIYNHNIYVSKGDKVIIRHNELYKSAVINGQADGVSMVVHGLHDSLLIEGNYVHEDPGMVGGNAWGIAVDPGGYGVPEGATGLIIRGNLLVNTFNTGIAITSCPHAFIENNVIIQENAGDFNAILGPDRMRDNDDLPMTNVTIRNNSIYLRNANVNTRAISLGDEGAGHVVVSNVVSTDGGNGFNMNLANSNYLSVDYNMMQLLNSAYWGGGQTLSAWSASRGFDLHSIAGDPLFTAPGSPGYDLMPLGPSPVIDAGHPTMSSAIDYTGMLRLGIADIGAFESLGTLPITLVFFEGRQSEENVLLNWVTASEHNNLGFEIEESQNREHFQKIGKIQGNGTAFEQNHYTFNVKNPAIGINYYRLKQIDFEGQFDYSPVISVHFKERNGNIGAFYPNPSHSGVVTLAYTPQNEDEISVSVFDMTGKLVFSQVQFMANGENHFNFSALKKGFYLVKLGFEKSNIYRKLIIE